MAKEKSEGVKHKSVKDREQNRGQNMAKEQLLLSPQLKESPAAPPEE
jgi:hypothetical protein